MVYGIWEVALGFGILDLGFILDLVVFGFWISTKGGLVIGILDLFWIW